MSQQPLKFVLLFAENEVFSIFLEGDIVTVPAHKTDLIKTFSSEVEATLWKSELAEKGHSLTVGFLDYMGDVPFVESCEFLYRGDI